MVFYEILTGRALDIEDAPSINLLDPEAYFTFHREAAPVEGLIVFEAELTTTRPPDEFYVEIGW